MGGPLKQEENIVTLKIKQGPLSATVRRDYELNKKIQKNLTKYWQKLGHVITFTINFNENLKIHEIRTDDLINGVPKEPMTQLAWDTLAP